MGVDGALTAASPSMRVLALNSGSSSLKLATYAVSPSGERLECGGAVAPIGPVARFRVEDAEGRSVLEREVDAPDAVTAAAVALDGLDEIGVARPDAVGHRIVHGGPDHAEPIVVDARVLDGLRALVPFAPLHLPAEIAVLEEAMRRMPDAGHVAAFDTAFHRRLPEVAQRYALPDGLWTAGIRRFGFHGLSYEYVLAELGARADKRIVVAHLGSGASLAAIDRGRPLDTTMGLTPTGGIPMATRSGDLDPGVLIHLVRERHHDVDGLERMVNRKSGLLGVSGTSADMKTLLDARESDARAALAVAMFCARVRSSVGALTATLGGLDLLVFTGGIGEKAVQVRAEVCSGLAHLGVLLDTERNLAGEPVISSREGTVEVRVVHTREEQMIARHVARLLA